ncbi:MAG: transcriptional repressor NrdR [Anaerolineae bacterium]|nr:MAG: transcriptional repressor NrdR [Anaerolineae bacterium]
MKCPYCGKRTSRVVDTREAGDGIRRRRECMACEQRFTTYERVRSAPIMVVKGDSRREPFDRDKLLQGVRIACAKRPIPMEDIEQLADEVESYVRSLGKSEVSSQVVGEQVIARLRELDDVAYVRFASVYRRFADVESLAQEIEDLLEKRARGEEERSS